MLEKGKISARQYTVLVILYTIGTSILIVPSSLAAVARRRSRIVIGTDISCARKSFSRYDISRVQLANFRQMVGKNGFPLIFIFCFSPCIIFASGCRQLYDDTHHAGNAD